MKLFKKNVRGSLQGAIRLDMSVERLVAGMAGKDSNLTLGEFFATDTAISVVKHFGSLYLRCRESHCRRAYLICLQKAYLSPCFTGGEIDGPADESTVNELRNAFKSMGNTVLNMRSKTLTT